jgi:methionine synthase I (cobalamin-dependent)
MHTRVEDTAAALAVLREHWDGPLLAYAETGKLLLPEWLLEEVISPPDYAAVVEGWIRDYGVRIVGGCCGTGPEHIRALHDMISGIELGA